MTDFDSASLLQVLVAGDLCPQGRPEKRLSSDSARDFWHDIPDVTESHDLSIVNLECPLTRSDSPIVKSGPHLRSDPRCAAGIRAGGFDVVTLANNHILDMGEQGLLDTLKTCREAGLRTVGAGRNLSEAVQPLFLTIKDTRIAILAFAEQEFSIATPNTAGAWPLDEIANYYQISQAQEEADFVLISLHGGNEGYPLPSPRLNKVCRYFAALGAGAVVCHHSHVAGGMEVVHGVPIVYGTGNLLFDWPSPRPPGWYKGFMVSLQLKGYKAVSVELIPYVQCQGDVGLHLLQGEEAASFQQEVQTLSAIIQDSEALEREWLRFCRDSQNYYVARLVAANQLSFRLWSRGILRLNHKSRVSGLLNLIQCQAHRDVLIENLRRASKGR